MEATEVQTNAPICKTQICKRPLTYMEKQKCWRCLICNPIPKDAPKPKKEKKFLDVKVTEEQVEKMIEEAVPAYLNEKKIREIVQEELRNWHIQKSPATRDEIVEAVGVGDSESNVHVDIKIPKSETWLQKAKRLRIRTHNEGTGGMRKKVDIMTDMETKENELLEKVIGQPSEDDGFVSPEGDTKTYEPL